MIAIIYTSLVALVQEDMKKLIAYSSVAHMGFVTMGIFAFNRAGRRRAPSSRCCRTAWSRPRCSCAWAWSTTACTRARSPPTAAWSIGMPIYAFVFMLFTMANVGLPGTSGFVGEFLTLVGVFKANTWVAFFATTGVILSAAYALWLYRRVMFGALVKDSLKTITDMDTPRDAVFAPLVVGRPSCSASTRRRCSTSRRRRSESSSPTMRRRYGARRQRPQPG